MRRVALVAVLSLLWACTAGGPSTTTTLVSTTLVSTQPMGVGGYALIVPAASGIEVLFPDGSERLVDVEASGPYAGLFAGVSTVLSDGAGGIVFQHELTPPPWVDGTILHLAAGATTPEVLVEPPVDSGEDELFGREWRRIDLELVDVVELRTGPAMIYLESETSEWGMGSRTTLAKLVPLGGGTEVTIAEAWGGSGNQTETSLHGVSCSGELCVVSFGDEYGARWFEFRDVNGESMEMPTNPLPCLEPRLGGSVCAVREGDELWPDPVEPRLSRNEDLLLFLDGNELVVFDLVAGTVRRRIPVTPYDSWSDRVFYDGDATVVITHAGMYEVVDLDTGDEPKLFFYEGAKAGVAATLDFANEVSLGSVGEDVPCSAAGLSSVPTRQTGLPGAVEATRREIVRLATACDFAGLGALRYPASPTRAEDLARSWLEDERRGVPRLAALVRLLDLPYATTRDLAEYVWPSAARPTLAAWEALQSGLVGMVSDESLALMREWGYAGVRVMIAANGGWVDDPQRKPWDYDQLMTLPLAGSSPSAFLLADPPRGLRVTGADSDRVIADPYWPSEIRVARDDGSGGIVFQYLDTPPTYPDGSILHLAAGAARPRLAVRADPTVWTVLLEVVDIEGVLSVVYVTSPAASTVGWYDMETEPVASNPRSLWTVPLAGGEPRLVGVWGRDGEDTTMWSASYADGRFLITVGPKSGENWWCRYFEILDVGTPTVEEPIIFRDSSDDCRSGSTMFDDVFYSYGGTREGVAPTLSTDGSVLVYERQVWFDWGNEDWNDAVIIDLSSGRSMEIPGERVWAYDRNRTLLITRDGRLELVTFDHDGFTIAPVLEAVRSVWAESYMIGFMTTQPALSPRASIASEVEQIPCSLSGGAPDYLPLPDLPAPVEETRQTILAATVNCDYDLLARLAEQGGLGQPRGFIYSLYWAGFFESEHDELSYPTITTVDEDPLYHWPRDDLEVGLLRAMNSALNGEPTRVDTPEGAVWVFQYDPLPLEMVINETGSWLAAGEHVAPRAGG